VAGSFGRARVGVVGGRGAVGQLLMRLLRQHPGVEVVFGEGERRSPGEVAALGLDALVLSAPNGVAGGYVAALAQAPRDPVVIDVSSDHRFDEGWVYGLPERGRDPIRGARRIANPGCYATGAQIGLEPFLDLLAGPPTVFGVSGYSGAGTTPSPRNDPARLADNLLPYALVDHAHEREISHHLGRAVRFLPHVAPFFVGITLTISFSLNRRVTAAELEERASTRWAAEPLIAVVGAPPEVRDARDRHEVTVGGFAVSHDGDHAALVVTLDNLLKGAATQAVQNLNLALGFDELAGIRAPEQP
jgi:N-acetyl-gamma-glutamyl-phosphate reductase